VRRIVVIGAGLSGLATAWHARARGFHPIVLEQEAAPGGACRTENRDGFLFDYTGHLLHVSRPEVRDWLGRLGILAGMREHTRRAAVCLAGTVTPYPVQVHTARLPATIRRDCLLGYIEALLKGDEPAPATASFADWVSSRFGTGLARHFFFPYNSKLFLADPDDFTAEWTGAYVPRPALAAVVDGALGLHRGPVGYNASFLYPKTGGIRLLADTLADQIGDVRTSCRVVGLSLATREIELDSGELLPWDSLIATVALPALARLTTDLPTPARLAAAQLRAVDVWNLNLGIRGRALRREHWLYVPEQRYPFFRVGLPSNHGRLAPRGCHTVSVEVSLPRGDQPAPELTDRCLAGLEELGLLRDRRDVLLTLPLRITPAYVVYDTARVAAISTLRATFGAAGVGLAGRWAEWGYSAMEDALWAGASAANGLPS
jgi:protoporphyrinogen oxidase